MIDKLIITLSVILTLFIGGVIFAMTHPAAFVQTVQALGIVLTCIVGYIIWHHHHMAAQRRKMRSAEREQIEAEARRQRAIALQEEQRALALMHQASLTKIEVDMRSFFMQAASFAQQQGGSYKFTQSGFEVINPVRVVESMPVQQAPAVAQVAAPVVSVPHAPPFSHIAHLISDRQLILCYTAQGPVYGTVVDLLSMCVVGKPGRGKSTALLYYILVLLMAQAEVWIWDPHSGLNELSYGLNYYDDLEQIEQTVPVLHKELNERRQLWRDKKQTKHPLLLLVDEMPVIADFENARAKEVAKLAKTKKGQDEDEPDAQVQYEQWYRPSRLLKRFVLEARKWNCYVILSGQALPAEVLSTLTRDNMSSRIVFESSNMHARMAGLQKEQIDALLPQLRGAGPGVAVMDVSRWSHPEIAAIPYTTVNDLKDYIDTKNTQGNVGNTWGNTWEWDEEPLPQKGSSIWQSTTFELERDTEPTASTRVITGGLVQDVEPLPVSTQDEVINYHTSPNMVDHAIPVQQERYTFTPEEVPVLLALYKVIGNVDKVLREMAKSQRYHKDASRILKERGLIDA